MDPNSTLISIAMLKAVIAGKTYDAVAAEHHVTRTAVERRIKTLALTLGREVGIEGLNQAGLGFVQRLRTCSAAITAALERYTPPSRGAFPGPILTDEQIGLLMQRTRARSTSPHRDMALLYIILCAGVRPLETARLEVRDYLNADGSVREESMVREDVAVNRIARPLFFVSSKVVEATDAYLATRPVEQENAAAPAWYRGLDPHGRLFRTEAGAPFEIVNHGRPGQTRFLCKGILDTYRTIFRRIGIDGLSALNLRRTVAARMLERGATEGQIGEFFGIGDPKSVRDLLPSQRRPLQLIVRDLV